MKVIFVLSSLSRAGGGVTEVARHLAQHLNAFTSVYVRTFGLRDEFTRADAAMWEAASVSVFNVVGPRSFGYAPQLIPAMRTVGADILHCHGLWSYTSLATLRVTAGGTLSVVSPHGMLDPWALQNSAWKKRVASLWFERNHLRRASCLHAVSAPELEAIRRLGLSNPVCLIPNGVEIPAKSDAPDNSVLGAKNGQRVLFYLGRLHPKKGLHMLLDAWALARTRCSYRMQDWILAIAGWEGMVGYEQELRARAIALSIDNQVTFPGPLYGLTKTAAFNSAEAFVLASVSEGMPLAILEAWAHNLPVVMSPQCNIAEGFAAGAAIKAEPTLTSLAAGLETLFAMSDLERQRMGSNGKRLVELSFTWSKAADRMRAVYGWLIGGSSRPDSVVTN